MLPRILMLVCLASLLSSCGPVKTPPPDVRTEVVEVKQASYVALSPGLLRTVPEPDAPQRRCRDTRAQPTVCHRDELNYIDALRAWGRGLVKQVKEIAGLQPQVPQK